MGTLKNLLLITHYPPNTPEKPFVTMLSDIPNHSESEKQCYKVLRAVINAQHNAGKCLAEGS